MRRKEYKGALSLEKSDIETTCPQVLQIEAALPSKNPLQSGDPNERKEESTNTETKQTFNPQQTDEPGKVIQHHNGITHQPNTY